MTKSISLIATVLLGAATLTSAEHHHHTLKTKLSKKATSKKFFDIPTDGQPMF
jgi:hypothetical protein